MSRIAVVLSCAAVICACATEPKPLPAALDPSNPSAPEAAPLDVGPPPERVAFTVDAGSASGSGSDAGTAVIYTCPMHPQVRSDKPGRCPICGMKLVPLGGDR